MMLFSSLIHHLMQFPDPGPNLLVFLEAADTKDVAGLMWPGTIYPGCEASVRQKGKASVLSQAFPRDLWEIFLGQSKAVHILPLWTMLVGSGYLFCWIRLKSVLWAYCSLVPRRAFLLVRKHSLKGNLKSSLDVFFILNLLFKFCKHL